MTHPARPRGSSSEAPRSRTGAPSEEGRRGSPQKSGRQRRLRNFCPYSRTGWAFTGDDGERCTCQPAKAPEPTAGDGEGGGA